MNFPATGINNFFINGLLILLFTGFISICGFNGSLEYVFTMESRPKQAGIYETNGSYTLSFNFKSDTAFCRKRSATFFEYGSDKAYIEYPYLYFITGDDKWQIMLDGTCGYGKIDDRTFHRLTFRTNKTQKDFLVDSMLVESRKINGHDPLNAALVISSPAEMDRLSGTVANLNFQSVYIRSANETEMQKGELDSIEYPPGYVPGSQDYTQVHSVTEQLQNYPSPEYKDTCDRMFSCYNLEYVSGAGQDVPVDTVFARGKEIQKILSLKFNWGIKVSDNLGVLYSDVADHKPSFDSVMIELAGELPGVVTDFGTGWAHLNSTAGLERCDAKASTVNSGLNYFDNDRLLYYQMGLTLKRLMAGKHVDRHFEDNEYLPSYIGSDRNIASESYERYTNYILDSMRSLFPGLKSTEYDIHDPSFYTSNGILFKERIRISNQGLGTVQFYTRTQNNWRLWNGDRRGLGFYFRSKKGEINAGYPLNSPFVCAGWDKEEEKNIRPSCWCGLLSILQVAGIKYFYPAYFTLSGTGVQNPKGYCWQMVIPSYVQASVSPYWKIIIHGELLKGDVLSQYYRQPGTEPQYEYNFWSGNKEVFTVVRKLGDEYLIATTHQRLNSYKSEYPADVSASIRLNGKLLTFESRPQGSIYYYNENTGVLRLINKEIGKGHPERWHK